MGKGDYLGEFEHVVLLALARLGPQAYGMTIYDEIRETTGREVSIPAVYVTLSRLEEKGYVTASLGESTTQRGGRAKKHFELTSAGASALEKSRQLLSRLWKGVELGAYTKKS